MRIIGLGLGLLQIVGVTLVSGSICLVHAQHAPSDASYPAPGHAYEAQFGARAFKLEFDPAKAEFSFTRADGSSDTVSYTAKEIRPGVFMVYWKEANDGPAVTHIQDFEKGIVDANIATKDGKFYNLRGTWKRLD